MKQEDIELSLFNPSHLIDIFFVEPANISQCRLVDKISNRIVSNNSKVSRRIMVDVFNYSVRDYKALLLSQISSGGFGGSIVAKAINRGEHLPSQHRPHRRKAYLTEVTQFESAPKFA